MPCQQPKAVAKDWAKLCETLMKLAMKGHARSFASQKGFAIADGQANSEFLILRKLFRKEANKDTRPWNCKHCKKGFGKPTGKNHLLVDPEESLTVTSAGLKDGQCLFVVILSPQLLATGRAFALWRSGGQSDPGFGGASWKVQDLLQFWQVDRLLLGAIQVVVGIKPRCDGDVWWQLGSPKSADWSDLGLPSCHHPVICVN